jgi:hypothetical protein
MKLFNIPQMMHRALHYCNSIFLLHTKKPRSCMVFAQVFN